MFVDFIIDKISENAGKDALAVNDKVYCYRDILNSFYEWQAFLEKNLKKGDVVAVKSDFSAECTGLLLALTENANIIVPLSPSNADNEEFIKIAAAEKLIDPGLPARACINFSPGGMPPLIKKLKDEKKPGIIMFSSGSSGKPKAAVNDFSALLNKFKKPAKSYRTISFLMSDHWGGINTLLHIISNAGMVVIPQERTPENICRLIEKYKIELLPVTPTFLNMLLVSEAHKQYDLSSLKLITYGTEMMTEFTLKRIHALLPDVVLKQTYGLTELGVLRTLSRSPDSLWLKAGGEDYETKIVDGILFIKAKTTMLGYLNAPSPVDKDGWYNTGDCVETDGEWIRFAGRKSDIINVGGQKVFPAEVESLILQMPEVKDCAVYGEKNIITGQVVAVDIVVHNPAGKDNFKNKLRLFLRDKTAPYKIPVKIRLTESINLSARFKKIRG